MARILLVEDDVDVRFTIEHILLNVGHQIDSAGTVEDGCELLRCRPYDLLIADGADYRTATAELLPIWPSRMALLLSSLQKHISSSGRGARAA